MSPPPLNYLVSVHERIVSQPAGCERTDHGSEAGWGLACVFSRRIRNLSLDLLDLKARAITANKVGALAYIARSMVALLHIVPSAYMGSSFSPC